MLYNKIMKAFFIEKSRILTLTCCFAALAALLVMFGTNNDSSAIKNSNKVYIVTTTAHIGDLVKNITGVTADVKSLMGTGTDPHLYRPVRSDIVKLSNADIVFYNGQHLEGQMVELMKDLGKNKPVIGLAYKISNLIKDDKDTFDPHIWMDVRNWIEATDVVASALSEQMPEHRAQFMAAAQDYKSELEELNKHIKASIQSIPEKNRVLVTAHDAFGYYGHAYGIEVVGIQGLSTASEAGLYKIEQIVSRISNDQIPAIFTETSVSDQNIKAIREGVKARGYNVKIGGSLYSDSLGAPNTHAGTYIGMMEHNTNAITKALGGNYRKTLKTALN